MGERDVCNVEVAGSSPAGSIKATDEAVKISLIEGVPFLFRKQHLEAADPGRKKGVRFFPKFSIKWLLVGQTHDINIPLYHFRWNEVTYRERKGDPVDRAGKPKAAREVF